MFLSTNMLQVLFADEWTTNLLLIDSNLYFKTANSGIAKTSMNSELIITCDEMKSGLKEFIQKRLDYLQAFLRLTAAGKEYLMRMRPKKKFKLKRLTASESTCSLPDISVV